jgi:S1-C subfamily serine protease
MHKTVTTETPSKQQHRLLRGIITFGLLCLFMLGIASGTAGTSYAAGRPGGNVTDPVVRAVDIAEPAVVRIITTLGGRLTVRFSTTNSVTFPQPGSTSNNSNGTSYPIQLSGSGTFISAKGDILTADHVINPPRNQELNQYLDDLAASDVAAYINQNAKSGSQVTAAQVAQELKSGQLSSDPSYDPATSQVFLNTYYTGPLSATSFQDIPPQIYATVDRIEKESAVNQSDVAIVHVNMNDMPMVQLGDSSNVQQQDQLSIIGFPGNGDVSSKPTDILTPSVNLINVSSTKTTDSGAQVIQVGGNVEQGDSGGPALDTTGAVVGIVSFGLSSANSPGGTSFLQASNSARTLVQSLNLDTTPGPFQKAWNQAFADYAATFSGHWHKAQQEFAKLASSYPQFKAITPYLTYAQQQAKTEKTTPTTPTTQNSSTQSPILAYVLTIGSILLLLALAVFLSRMIFRSSRKKKRAASEKVPGATQAQAARQSQPASIPQRANAPGVSAQQVPLPPMQQGQTVRPQPVPLPEQDDEGLSAFGAPPRTIQQPISSPSSPPSTIISGTLRPWPCGHMNRSNARFCSICGEPAPSPPTRQFEQ